MCLFWSVKYFAQPKKMTRFIPSILRFKAFQRYITCLYINFFKVDSKFYRTIPLIKKATNAFLFPCSFYFSLVFNNKNFLTIIFVTLRLTGKFSWEFYKNVSLKVLFCNISEVEFLFWREFKTSLRFFFSRKSFKNSLNDFYET